MPSGYEDAGPFSAAAMVRRLTNDMYHGNGKPGITTRIQTVEDAVEDIKEQIKEFKDGQKWITRLIIATIVLAILNLVIPHYR